MKTGVNRKTFFTRKEYKQIQKKHNIELNYVFYKELIKTYNKFLCKEILENGDVLLPNELGQIKINKYKPKSPIYNKEKDMENKEYNFHTFGYLYYFKWVRGHKYETLKKRDFGVKHKLLKFFPHRMNLRRPLAKILKSGERDYAIYKQ